MGQSPAKAAVSAFSGEDYDSKTARKAERNKANLPGVAAIGPDPHPRQVAGRQVSSPSGIS